MKEQHIQSTFTDNPVSYCGIPILSTLFTSVEVAIVSTLQNSEIKPCKECVKIITQILTR